MEIRLLGPVELHGPAGEVDIGPPIRRCVLAALTVDSGRVVVTEELIRRVWGDDPSVQVRKTLQAHVTRLRKALAAAGDAALVNRNGGYVLLLAPEQTDLGRFRASIAAGRAAVRAGEDERAARCYRQAARLWRGEPFSGVDSAWMADFRVTVTDQRLTAAEVELEIGLRLGNQAELVDEALALARAHLDREHLVILAMQCLYRCGRQTESLELCREVVAFLRQDGLNPGGELRSLQERVLRNDPTLMASLQAAEPAPACSAARRDLAREMRRLWLAQRHDAESRVELWLREQPGAVWDGFADRAPPDLETLGPMLPGARLTDLVLDRFNRRLLVLGDKGSGKTTSLVDLAADLLARAENPEVPVPVILLLSRWRNRGTDLGEWIVEEIRDHYRLRADRIRTLLASDDLVVLLDGLDEMPASLRPACAKAINAFRINSSAGIVVSSRTAEYVDLDIRLALAGAVVIQPLTEAQIDARLRDGGAALAGLRDEARRDLELAEHLSTPHMLDVVCLAYLGGTGTVSPTTGGSYDQYLATLLHRARSPLPGATRPAGPFDVQTTRRFVVWLARLMTACGETMWYPDHLAPAALPGTDLRWPLPATAVSRLAAGVGLRRLATALTYGLAAAILCGTMYGLQLGLGRAAARDTPLDASPLFAALVALTVFALVTVVFTTQTQRWWLRITVYALTLMLAGGLHKGLITGRIYGGAQGWRAGVTGALVYGLTTAASVLLALGAVALLLHLEKGPSRWNWSWRRAVLCADTAVACGLAVGVSHALARFAAAPQDALYSLLAGFGYGVIMGLGGGVLLGLGFMLIDLDVARPAARWHLSARRLASAALVTGCFGILHWLCFVYGLQLILGPDKGPLFSLVLGVTFCLTFALGHSLMPEHNLPVPAPAHALGASLRVAVRPVSGAGFIALLATALTRPEVAEYVQLALVVPAVLAVLLTFWFTGGGVWLAHHVARRTAQCAGILPPDLFGFLAHADERMLLHRHGGGYRFRHPELQRHIADGVPDTVPSRR